MTRLPALLGPDLASKASAIAGYYLFDTGGSFTDVVQAAVGIDIPGMLASFNATRDDKIAVRLMPPWPLRAGLHSPWFMVLTNSHNTSGMALSAHVTWGGLVICAHRMGHACCMPHRSASRGAETGLLLLVQTLQGHFVLRAKLVAVVDSVITVSGAVERDLTSAEALASYESIHPLYLQAAPCQHATFQADCAPLAWHMPLL